MAQIILISAMRCNFNKEIRMEKMNVKPATGKLGVLCVGLGAVTSTFMTGVLMARKGLAKPVGSMTQYDKMRVGRGENKKYLHYGEIVPLANLNDIVFGAWDVYPANAYESAVNAEVLKEKDINPVKDELEKIVPMKAAFDHNYASRLDGDNVKDCKNRWDMMEQLREDIRNFKVANNCDRIVVLWAASTEIYVPVDEKIHGTLAALEQAMKDDDKAHIAPSMCYAYAALSEGCPFIMGAPNTTVDIPAMWELAEKTKMPIAGKDFKTGQTLVKSGFAPIIGTRCLGLDGWFSTNILGNRDGLVLDEPANFHTKEVSKLSTLESILVPEDQPDLYTDYYHKVRINYYPPRNDNKEGWDNIDIFGWPNGYRRKIRCYAAGKYLRPAARRPGRAVRNFWNMGECKCLEPSPGERIDPYTDNYCIFRCGSSEFSPLRHLSKSRCFAFHFPNPE